MAYNQAYNAYKTTSVKTASQGKLVVMLYDEAIKQLTYSITFLDNERKILPTNIDKFNAAILKAQEIITELTVSLNMTEGGEIAQNLLNLYTYFNQELLDANLNRNKEKLQFVLNMMSELRSAWAEIESAVPSGMPTGGISINS